jgi:hypothetical protein
MDAGRTTDATVPVEAVDELSGGLLRPVDAGMTAALLGLHAAGAVDDDLHVEGMDAAAHQVLRREANRGRADHDERGEDRRTGDGREHTWLDRDNALRGGTSEATGGGISHQ